MVTKIIQAVAGAGKTYHVTHELINQSRCLYVTFTNGNVQNIKKELADSGKNTETYSVMTFSKFIIDWFIYPFQNNLCPIYGQFKGFTKEKPISDARLPGYKNKDEIGHYITTFGNLYLSRLSELIVSQNKTLLTSIFDRISMFVDHIVVDEYQDLTGHDFNLLKIIAKQKQIDVTIVGDIFQSGVVNSLSNGKKDQKIAKFSSDYNITQFLEKIFASKKIQVDVDSLAKSRRISKECADFVTEHLDIPIQSQEFSKGKVIFVESQSQLEQILDTEKELEILVYKNKNSHYNTWTYSKGDTYPSTLVVLTANTDYLITGKSTKARLTNATRNSLYVALTRSAGNLYIVGSELWKKYRV